MSDKPIEVTIPTTQHTDAPPPASTASLAAALTTELLALSYHGFAACMRHLLKALGYENVHIMGRTHWKQRTSTGGVDLEAFSHAGLTHGRVVVLIKQYRRTVSRRFVDELRGTMLRLGARHGLLITTSDFSKTARRAAEDLNLSAVAPVRLINGQALTGLMRKHGVGVLPSDPDTDDLLYVLYHGEPPPENASDTTGDALDSAYFAKLHRRFPKPPKR